MKNKKSKLLLTFLVLLVCSINAQVPFSNGRIAISSDGNYGDDDDWGATPASLMMLAKAGLQDNVVLYTFSDHVWGNNSQNDVEQMRTSINGAKDRWNYNSTNFIEAVNNPEAAYNAMRDAINASTASNPLTIICAGPMHVVGTAMDRANASARQYVTLISHSEWNDNHACQPYSWENHDGWCWNEMVTTFTNANFIHIVDQNSSSTADVGFSTGTMPDQWAYWYWMRDHQDESVRWLYNRMLAVNRADISDAGMVWYLIHNDQYGSPAKLRDWIGDCVLSCNPDNVTGVSVSPTNTILTYAGATRTLKETVVPSTATNKNVTWQSSNNGIATVSSTGVVTAVSNGSANITVTTNDGGYTAVCGVYVDIDLTGNSMVIEVENFNKTGGSYGTDPCGADGFNATAGGVNCVNSGDWGEYDIVVGNAGEYNIEYQISTPTENAQVQFLLDGTLISTDNVTNNGDWDNYYALEASNTANISIGLHTIRVVASGSNAWQWNMEKITLTKASGNLTPTANAGNDQTLTAGNTTADLIGSGSDPDGDALTYSWSQVSGPSITINNSNSANASISGLSDGNTYILSLTVSDGQLSDTDDVQITVESDHVETVTVEAESFNRTGGTYGTDVCGADGFNKTSIGVNCVNNGEYAEYDIIVPVAGRYSIEYMISTPLNGSVIKFLSDGNLLSTDNVPNNGEWDSYVPFTAGDEVALSAGSHIIRLEPGSNEWQWNLDKFTLTKSGDLINQAPIANAGSDQTLASGTTSTDIIGSGSDPDNDPITYSWNQQSGPNVTINNASSANASISGLSNGNTYVFRLTVSDGSLSGSDDVQITVSSGSGNPITIEAESFVETGGTFDDSPWGGPGFGAKKTGPKINWVNSGDYVDYNISIPEDGAYEVVYYISSPTTGSTITIASNGTNLNTTTVPNNGDWDDYTPLTVSETINISAGNPTITLTAGAKTWTWNLEKFTLQRVGAFKEAVEVNEQPVAHTLEVFPNPAFTEITVHLISKSDSDAKASVFNGIGISVLETDITQEYQTLDISNFSPGIYMIQVQVGNQIELKRFIKQ